MYLLLVRSIILFPSFFVLSYWKSKQIILIRLWCWFKFRMITAKICLEVRQTCSKRLQNEDQGNMHVLHPLPSPDIHSAERTPCRPQDTVLKNRGLILALLLGLPGRHIPWCHGEEVSGDQLLFLTKRSLVATSCALATCAARREAASGGCAMHSRTFWSAFYGAQCRISLSLFYPFLFVFILL